LTANEVLKSRRREEKRLKSSKAGETENVAEAEADTEAE
jgi:hypothetical protein